MSTIVARYIADLQREFATGHAQEHSYRPALKALFEAITKLKVVNEPKGSAHGRPDFIFLKGDIPIAYVEAKDITVNLDKIEKSEQMARYFGYANLILTNGLEFRCFKNGQKYGDGIVLAVKQGTDIQCKDAAYKILEETLADFVAEPIDAIRSAQHLAKIMGGKARRLRDNITEILDPAFTGQKGDIDSVMQILKAKLIHDLTPAQFADLYAQTLVYGLFVARYNDDTPETFSRTEAREKIPASNHLLQQFFDHIAGANFIRKLSYIVDELCDVFVHSDVKALVHGLYEQTSMEQETHDPIIHFYEDFLKEYDPALRLSRGVFYTPLPVVRFIVRSVDALLKEHFGLSQGLADRSKIDWERTEHGKKFKEPIDRVQILDPAVGTGTFLNEVIRNVHERYKDRKGEWPAFVNEHLLPRLHGFELMMASYTIAHLKLSMTLAETGITKITKRLRVFLTNSLEQAPEKDDSLFGLGLQEALTEEAHMADEVKRDYPIMVVMGNPPYSVSSQNASTEIGPDGKKRKTWIGALIDDYKKNLNEKKLNLDDDYIKFLRFSHHLIEKNKQGIVAMITNNSFLDGITHRRMRESLLGSFDHIYVLDLHGDSNMKEKAQDGSKDENVFDIQQGVGITLFVKTGEKKKLGTVHHFELYGLRSEKYDWLNEHDVSKTLWKELEAPKPNYFFVPKDFERQKEYDLGLKLSELFPIWNSGVKTDRDGLFTDMDRTVLGKRIETLLSGSFDKQFEKEFRVEDSGSYKITKVLQNVQFEESFLSSILYRPFDVRAIYYDPAIISRPGAGAMVHMFNRENLGLLTARQNAKTGTMDQFFVTNLISEIKCAESSRQSTLFPLYLYPDSTTVSDEKRRANLDMKLLEPVLNNLKITWISDGIGDGKKTCGPEDILDYIYAVLHCPTYRSRYKEFLKIDFPRVPFTSDAKLFWKLVTLGREIRLLHLMESPKLEELITGYPMEGEHVVEKVSFELNAPRVDTRSPEKESRSQEKNRASSDNAEGKVWINKTQYFDCVPLAAWEFYIGGYQPLQKWLKDRKGRTLGSDDLLHWQKIVVALMETDRMMKEIDEVIAKSGGWPVK
ncbi:MAG: N-6 DNA methylase [Candidatus Peribacteraceae bacterium]|nr:N-6 DNA methylase [Candidatus Peribacteraceae bacterium]